LNVIAGSVHNHYELRVVDRKQILKRH